MINFAVVKSGVVLQILQENMELYSEFYKKY